jgi:DNA-binding NtrC family response regulator
MALSLLVVDDHPVTRSMLLRTIRQSGLPLGRVMEAGSAEGALCLLEAQRAALVIVDLDMPDGEGVNLVERVHLVAPGAAIIVMHGDALPATVAAKLAASAVTAVAKPCSPEPFRAAALRAVERANSR